MYVINMDPFRIAGHNCCAWWESLENGKSGKNNRAILGSRSDWWLLCGWWMQRWLQWSRLRLRGAKRGDGLSFPAQWEKGHIAIISSLFVWRSEGWMSIPVGRSDWWMLCGWWMQHWLQWSRLQLREEMNSVSLLNDKRHIAMHSNNILIFPLIIDLFVHKLSISRIPMHRMFRKIYFDL